jgi:hypothetical protein
MLDMSVAARSRLVWVGLLLLLCVGLHWKLVLTDQYTCLDSPDLANMELPRFQFQAAEWRHSRFPLWDPHHWCGQPFLGQFTGAAYPLNWLLPHLPFEQGKIRRTVLHWYFVLIHFQGALFAYWLCRDLGRSRAASLLAGLVFAFGAFVGNTDWPQVLNGAVWAPAVFLFLLRALRGQRPVSSAALSGAFLGLAWLSGHHEAPTYLTAAAGGVWLFHIACGRGSRKRLLGLAALAALFTVLASGLQTVPGYEYGKLSRRWAGTPEPLAWNEPVPYTVHEHYSFTPASLLGIVLPGQYRHVNPFIGVVALTLALVAIAAAWKDHPPVRLFAAVALGGLLFAMASQNLFHGILYSLAPLFGKARVPARAIVVFNLGIAPLVAFGLDALREASAAAWLRRAAGCLAALGAGVFGVAGVLAMVNQFPADARWVFTGLAALLAAALLAAGRAGAITGPALTASLVLLSVVELGNVSGAQMPNLRDTARPSALAQLRAHDDVASFLRQQPQPLRVQVNDRDVPYNFGDWHGIDTLSGYVAGVTANVLELETHRPRIQDLLAVNYTVAREPTRPGQELVFRGASGVNVYRNPSAYPRARVVHELVRVPSYGDLRKLYQDERFDLRRKAAVLGPPPPLEPCGAGEEVRVTALDPSRMVLDAALQCRGMVVLADTAFPGWVARVDGRPAPIHEVDGALRGVVVERGHHRIEMTYRPASALLGAAMTLLGLLGAGLLRWRDRRRYRSP